MDILRAGNQEVKVHFGESTVLCQTKFAHHAFVKLVRAQVGVAHSQRMRVNPSQKRILFQQQAQNLFSLVGLRYVETEEARVEFEA